MKLKIESKLLQEKLNGKIPITREELLILVNSWGRLYSFITNNEIEIKKHESKECYDLSKLDVSKITNMDYIFKYSLFDGDISSWNVSNVTSMSYMFYDVESFNQNISSWNFDNIISCDYMFYNAKAFKDRYNSGKPLPEDTDDIKTWININRDRMNAIDIKENHGEEIDDFFSNINLTFYQNATSNLLTECNKSLTECNKQFACKKSCL